MSEEPDKTADEEIEDAAPMPDDAGGDAATADPAPTAKAEPAEEPSRPHGDELAEVVDQVGETAPAAEGDDEETEAPKRRRRPSRRRAAASAEDEPEAEAASDEPEAEEPPAAPAPTRRRSRRDPNEPAPIVRAQAKYVRSSARKARLVCDHIRGKSVDEARAILAVTPRAIAKDWSKLLESAIANAEHNHELVGEDLYVKAVHADEGPTIKRFRPRAMGRATRIRKRTSHLTILLTPKD
jgi:ribosomal protein L22